MMTQQEFAKRFALLAPLLCKNHYCVTPIKPNTKLPLLSHWQDKPYTYQNLPIAHVYEDHGVGILCGIGDVPIVALDIDAPCKELSEAMKAWCIQTLGAAPERVGRPPKTLLIYRADTPGWKKIKSAVFYDKDHNKNQLEILGSGQQFVAFGKHPDTGKDFEWPNGSPIDKPAYELTIISAEKLQLAIEHFEGLAAGMGLGKASGSKAKTSISFAARPDAQSDALDFMKSIPAQRLGMTLEQAKEALTFIKDNEDYDIWLSVGMALHYEFDGSDEAFDLWDEWSSTASNYSEYEGLQHKWITFNRAGGNVLTGFWLRKRAQEAKGIKLEIFRREDNDRGNTQRLLDRFGNDLKYNVDKNELFRWAEPIGNTEKSLPKWALATDAGKKTMAQITQAGMAEESLLILDEEERKSFFKFKAKSQSAKAAREMLWGLDGSDDIKVRNEWFIADKRYLGTPIGSIDIYTGTPREINRDDRITQLTLMEFDNLYEPCELFEKTVSEVFWGDKEMIEYFQKVIGYSIMGNPKEHAIFMLLGSGANGKGTLLNAICDVLGDYAASTKAKTIMGNGDGSNTSELNPALLALKNKRFVYVEEPESRSVLQNSLVKSSASNDKMSARDLFSSYVEQFSPKWVAFMPTNHLPIIKDNDDGIWRRIKVIPFTRKFMEDPDVVFDGELPEKLKKEYKGILAWIIRGCLMYQEAVRKSPNSKGLIEPPAVRKAIDDYRESMNILAPWLSQYCIVNKQNKQISETFGNLWDSWSNYALHTRELKLIPNQRALVNNLVEQGFEKSRNIKDKREINGKRGWGFFGISLRYKTDEEQEDDL